MSQMCGQVVCACVSHGCCMCVVCHTHVLCRVATCAACVCCVHVCHMCVVCAVCVECVLIMCVLCLCVVCVGCMCRLCNVTCLLPLMNLLNTNLTKLICVCVYPYVNIYMYIQQIIITYVFFMYLIWQGGGAQVSKCCVSIAGDVNLNAYSSGS